MLCITNLKLQKTHKQTKIYTTNNNTMEMDNSGITFVNPPPTQASSSSSSSQLLGVIIPGRPLLTDFVPMDASGTKFAMTLTGPGQLPSPLTSVNELVCFVTPQALPPNHGLLVYWQLSYRQEQSGFELLGSLTRDRPSEIFRTGWSEHDQFLAIGPNEPVTITIGISIEPLDSVQNLAASTANIKNQSRRPFVAQKIAQDLFNFMNSFDTGSAGSTHMVVPKNIFERWWARFENKSKRDPNFFLKAS